MPVLAENTQPKWDNWDLASWFSFFFFLFCLARPRGLGMEVGASNGYL